MDFRLTIIDILLDRDGLDCKLCNLPFTLSEPPSIDHIVSQKAGGSDNIVNLQLLHKKCNGSKGSGVSHINKRVCGTKNRLALDEMEKTNNIKHIAARNLNISVRTLYRWLEM